MEGREGENLTYLLGLQEHWQKAKHAKADLDHQLLGRPAVRTDTLDDDKRKRKRAIFSKFKITA